MTVRIIVSDECHVFYIFRLQTVTESTSKILKLDWKTGFLARDIIYTSRAYATMPVRLSVCDVCALWSQAAMDPGYLCFLG